MERLRSNTYPRWLTAAWIVMLGLALVFLATDAVGEAISIAILFALSMALRVAVSSWRGSHEGNESRLAMSAQGFQLLESERKWLLLGLLGFSTIGIGLLALSGISLSRSEPGYALFWGLAAVTLLYFAFRVLELWATLSSATKPFEVRNALAAVVTGRIRSLRGFLRPAVVLLALPDHVLVLEAALTGARKSEALPYSDIQEVSVMDEGSRNYLRLAGKQFKYELGAVKLERAVAFAEAIESRLTR